MVWPTLGSRTAEEQNRYPQDGDLIATADSVTLLHRVYTEGDSDVISMLAGFRCHLVGSTLINVLHCDINEIRPVGKLMIVRTFS